MLLKHLWADVVALVGWLCPSLTVHDDEQQTPLGPNRHHSTDVSNAVSFDLAPGQVVPTGYDNFRGPVFYPPSGHGRFQCDYSAMGKEWRLCSFAQDRECWIRNIVTGEEYNINTDYETKKPIGRLREYELNITDSWLAADGLNFTAAKLFNNQYPGPLIEACWGDTIKVKVRNQLKFNGTSIHWHGIRQHKSMDMDGVNGVTQCPIAPGKEMTYIFETTQYGSSWYHSHYSVQYGDGMQGPITIHGPTSAPYDNAIAPLIMTDWNHLSGFRVLGEILKAEKDRAKANKTILLNGRGDVTDFGFINTTRIKDHYNITFEPREYGTTKRAKKYLLVLINTSFDTTFVVSIDNHWMQVVEADFVPIVPYYNTSVLVGIGQRYHVIVEADPDFKYDDGKRNNTMPGKNDGNFWIRTYVAACKNITEMKQGYERVGILRYDNSSKALPHSQPWPMSQVSLKCSDETYSSLVPKIPWYIGPAANDQRGYAGEQYNITGEKGRTKPWPHAVMSLEPLSTELLPWHPLRVNYSDPTITHLRQSGYQYPAEYVVLNEEYKKGDWIYLVLAGNGKKQQFGAHPIHLHGHDFALLQQAEDTIFDLEKTYKPKLDNPPRRDVVLLPTDGFVVIAFKPDNPGNWLLHCHIANHASFGLGYQILEDRKAANALYPWGGDSQDQVSEICASWEEWSGNCTNWYPGIDNKTGKNPACEDPRKYVSEFFAFNHDSGI